MTRPGALVLAVLFQALAVAAPAQAQAVNDQFDRGSGERRIVYTADGSRDTRKPVFTFNAHFVGQAVAMSIDVAFVSAGEGGAVPRSRFAGCHDIAWWIDGQPYASARAAHHGEVIDGDMVEMIDQEVTLEWIDAVAAAQSVRYRVCRDDYLLTAGDLRGFATVAAKLRNARMSSAAPAQQKDAATAPAEVEYKGMNWRPKHPSLFGSGK
ncbi:MAG: hypothetical protein ABWX93_08950 [Pseudoxanthomonas sp.]